MSPTKLLSDSDEDMVCTLYLSGEKVTHLANKFSVHKNTIHQTIRRRGIQRKTVHMPFTDDFFDCIDTADKAYWLGFLAADGCVFLGNSPGFRVILKQKDAGHLNLLKATLGCDHPVRLKTVAGFPQAGLDVRNQRIAMGLTSHGCCPNKTVLGTYPPLPQAMTRHFIRGIFDGDGSITAFQRSNRQGYVDAQFSIVGTLGVIAPIQAAMEKHVGLSHNSLIRLNGCWRLAWSGSRNVMAIYSFLYDDGGPKLERKHQRWLTILSQIQNNHLRGRADNQ